MVAYAHAINMQLKEEEECQSRILDANYDKVKATKYVQELDYLNESEKDLLLNTLTQFPTLFCRDLGHLKIEAVHLELKENAKLYAARPFPIPQALLATTQKEMDCLTSIGVFKMTANSEWAAPTFVQPKKLVTYES